MSLLPRWVGFTEVTEEAEESTELQMEMRRSSGAELPGG